MNGFYYIENSVDEYTSAKSAYFETLEEAKEAIKHFADWFCCMGTGRIYFQPFGIVPRENRGNYYVYTRKSAEFICRAKGIGEDGEVIFTDREF